MYIYNAAQIRNWDLFTIDKEPISSIQLMERASQQVADWLLQRGLLATDECWIFCGAGNNGGDGLCIARLLHVAGRRLQVFLIDQPNYSADNLAQQQALELAGVPINRVGESMLWPEPPTPLVVIDALFGTGLSRPVTGVAADWIGYINDLRATVVSIDMPSGLPADSLVAQGSVVVKANYTLTFQIPKFSFFLMEHAAYTGRWELLDIGLHSAYASSEISRYAFCNPALVQALLPPRRPVFSHKGQYGHALIAGGSQPMMGAPLLAAEASLHTGVGLLSVALPPTGTTALNVRLPEAMYWPATWLNQPDKMNKITAMCLGVGWENNDQNSKWLQQMICQEEVPLVLDATALRIVAREKQWLQARNLQVPLVLTPHPGEFADLTGKITDSAGQIEQARILAEAYQAIVVLKGAYTRVITPGGLVYFNSTGNAGMAKGGSGDVLAGLITGWLAQGMAPVAACLLGVYVHGLAGNLAAAQKGEAAFRIGDVVRNIPDALGQLSGAFSIMR